MNPAKEAYIKHVAAAKSQAPEGPWSTEVDWYEFKHAGLKCVLRRAALTLAWCGYVGVPSDHAFYKTYYEKINDKYLNNPAYGGLTYSRHSEELGEGLWWFGFDCSHCDDLCPGYMATSNKIYRDFQWVKQRCEELANWLNSLRGADFSDFMYFLGLITGTLIDQKFLEKHKLNKLKAADCFYHLRDFAEEIYRDKGWK